MKHYTSRLSAILKAAESMEPVSIFDSAIVPSSDTAKQPQFASWLARNPPKNGKDWLAELDDIEASLTNVYQGRELEYIKAIGKHAKSILWESQKDDFVPLKRK